MHHVMWQAFQQATSVRPKPDIMKGINVHMLKHHSQIIMGSSFAILITSPVKPSSLVQIHILQIYIASLQYDIINGHLQWK